MKVTVTGANGFFGRILCDWLRDRGHEVKPLVRKSSRGGEVAIGDMTIFSDWQSMFEGQDAVVHLAALVHQKTVLPDSDYKKTNVEVVANIVTAANAAKVQRFLFVSSAAVYDEFNEVPHQETEILKPLTSYAVSKLEAERTIIDFCDNSSIAYSILRPPLVYGPGAKGNFKSLVKLISSGFPLPFASVQNLRSFVYADNLADLLEVCLKQPSHQNHLLNACDMHDVSTPEFIAMIAMGLGKRPLLFPLPHKIISTAASIIGKEPAVRKLTGSFQLDRHKLTSELGWTPPFSVDQGLKRSLD